MDFGKINNCKKIKIIAKTKRVEKKKNFLKKKLNLLNISRTLIVLFSLFLALFALDTPIGIGFLIHLLPTIILLLTLILTWKIPKIAGTLFILEGIATVFVFNTYRDWFTLLIISIIPIAIGIMFLLSRYSLFLKK